MDTGGEKKKRTSKINVYGRSTNSHDNKKFITRSVEKQGGMAFGLCKMASVVMELDGRTDRQNGSLHAAPPTAVSKLTHAVHSERPH
jgi:hypothetical protein